MGMKAAKKVKLIKLDVAKGPLSQAQWLRTWADSSRKEGSLVQKMGDGLVRGKMWDRRP